MLYICANKNEERGRCPLFYWIQAMDSTQVQQWVEEIIKGSDLFVVNIKMSPARIAVFMDKPAGISIEECARVSRHIYAKLDAMGLMEKYELEVSSPGMESPLQVAGQYYRRIGRKLKVIDTTATEHTGTLISAGSEEFCLRVIEVVKEGKKKTENRREIKFQYSDVKEAKLILSFK